MQFREVLRLLDGSHPVEEAVQAYQEARRELERERCDHFTALGAAPEQPCPAASVYHAQSAISRDWVPRLTQEESYAHALDLGYKSYPGAPYVTLAESWPVDSSLLDAIRSRRSVSDLDDRPLDPARLATLLRLACGVTAGGRLPLRAAPSAGALFPVETYVLAFRVDDLEPGLYHYAPLDDRLERVSALPDRRTVIADVLAPGLADTTPPVILAMTAVLPRVQAKYGERGYRFSLLEAGHIGQNLSLLAAGLGLAGNCIGGFCDDEVNRLLGLPAPDEVALYLFLAGWPRPATGEEEPAP